MPVSVLFEPHDTGLDHDIDPVSEYVDLEPRYCGFGLRMDPFVVVLPYWSLVVPLTLLSAYLLLGKPEIADHTLAPTPIRDSASTWL